MLCMTPVQRESGSWRVRNKPENLAASRQGEVPVHVMHSMTYVNYLTCRRDRAVGVSDALVESALVKHTYGR